MNSPQLKRPWERARSWTLAAVLHDIRRALRSLERKIRLTFRRAVHDGKQSAARRKKISYPEWLAHNDRLNDNDRSLIRHHIAGFRQAPKFSIVMPVYNTPVEHLKAAIDSVRAQLYENWELCIADDASSAAAIRNTLEACAATDPRIKLVFREKNGGIAEASNSALAMASGDWVVLMDHDDRLSEHALYLIAEAIDRLDGIEIVYSDEDCLGADSLRANPYFKPDWNYDLLLGQNFLNHLCAYRTDTVRRAGGFRTGYEGSQDWDLALRVFDSAPGGRMHHIPFVLYHWRQTVDSFSRISADRARDAAVRAVNDHFARTGETAVAEAEGHSSHLRIRWALPAVRPLVSIVIPMKDKAAVTRQCLDGIFNRTAYGPIEVVIVDNGSVEPDTIGLLSELRQRANVRIVEDRGEFNFSRLVNRGVAASSGEVCLLLNNDVAVINPEWLSELVGHALRPHVGAVGAKLYYMNDTVQHGGVILGIGGVAGHINRSVPRRSRGYFNRLNLAQEVSCVTGACLAVRRGVYDAVGGFNERDLAISFNDVDFCIRLRQAGYTIIWTPGAELYHHESLSRGRPDGTPEAARRNDAEIAYMRRRWGPVLDSDPYYNPNLSLEAESFRLAPVTRARKPWRDYALVHARTNMAAGTMNGAPFRIEKLHNAPARSYSNVLLVGHSAAGKSALARALNLDRNKIDFDRFAGESRPSPILISEFLSLAGDAFSIGANSEAFLQLLHKMKQEGRLSDVGIIYLNRPCEVIASTIKLGNEDGRFHSLDGPFDALYASYDDRYRGVADYAFYYSGNCVEEIAVPLRDFVQKLRTTGF